MVSRLSSDEVLSFLIIVSVVLITSRLLGELFRKIKQPAVIGEILAGIVLGPSLLGRFSPNTFHFLFLNHPKAYSSFDGLANVGIIFLMFVAGMEVNLKHIRKRGKHAAAISLSGLLFPFIVGFCAVWFFYDQLFNNPTDNKLIPALFFGTALSITALSVCAKILMDLDILKTKVGLLTLTAAMIDDFLGWILFSIILQLMNHGHKGLSVFQSVGIVLLFVVFVLTIGKWLINKMLYLTNKYLTPPGGAITVGICLCLLGAVFTEYAGIRGIFGAFIVGIAVGDSKHFTQRTEDILHQFITNIIAPFFFASIGLRLDFVTNFNLSVVLFILISACVAKLIGAGVGSWLSGLNRNESLAVAFGMNARGGQEIVLGMLALQAGIIDDRIFVGLVVMTIVTILMSGPMMTFFIQKNVVAQKVRLDKRYKAII
jgi:Kef-type K+ transport system membrane component KefB